MNDYGVSVQQLNDLLSDENGHFSMPSRDFNEVYPRILLGNEYVLLKLHALTYLSFMPTAVQQLYHIHTRYIIYNNDNIRL